MEKKGGFLEALKLALGGAIGFEIFVGSLLFTGFSDVFYALLICAVINLLTMLSYSELSASIENGEYSYVKNAFGGFLGFTAGCVRWLSSIFGGALAAVFFSVHITSLISSYPTLQSIGLFVGPALIVLLTLVRMYARKLDSVVLPLFIVIFAIYIASGLLQNIHPGEATLNPTPTSFSNVVFFFPMFYGMRALVSRTSRIREPEKNVPRAMTASTIILLIFYTAVAYITVGLSAGSLGPDYGSPLVFSLKSLFGPFVGDIIIVVLPLLAVTASIGTASMVQSSIISSMSRDRYLPKFLSSNNNKTASSTSTILNTATMIIICVALLVTYSEAILILAYAASFSSILVFALVNLSLLQLNKVKPNLSRPYSAPFFPVTPITGIVMSSMISASKLLEGNPFVFVALLLLSGLFTLIVLTYYLRMIGRQRLQVALGGVNLSIGIFLALTLYLGEITFFSVEFSNPIVMMLNFFIVILITSGIINLLK